MHGAAKNQYPARQAAAPRLPPRVYWETQKDLHCGRHALNMLFGYSAFTEENIDRIAREVDRDCRLGARTAAGFPAETAHDYTSCATGGNWDADVLLKAANSCPDVSVAEFAQDEMPAGNTYHGAYIGSLIHEALHPDATRTECAAGHYTCLRKCGNQLYHLDSLKVASAQNEISFSTAQRIISRPNVNCWHVFRNPVSPASQPVRISVEVCPKRIPESASRSKTQQPPATVASPLEPRLSTRADEERNKQPNLPQANENRPGRKKPKKRVRPAKKDQRRPSPLPQQKSDVFESTLGPRENNRAAIGYMNDNNNSPGSSKSCLPVSKKPKTTMPPASTSTKQPPPRSEPSSGRRDGLFSAEATTPSFHDLKAQPRRLNFTGNTSSEALAPARETQHATTTTPAAAAAAAATAAAAPRRNQKKQKRQKQHVATLRNTIYATRKNAKQTKKNAARKQNANKSSRDRNTASPNDVKNGTNGTTSGKTDAWQTETDDPSPPNARNSPRPQTEKKAKEQTPTPSVKRETCTPPQQVITTTPGDKKNVKIETGYKNAKKLVAALHNAKKRSKKHIGVGSSTHYNFFYKKTKKNADGAQTFFPPARKKNNCHIKKNRKNQHYATPPTPPRFRHEWQSQAFRKKICPNPVTSTIFATDCGHNNNSNNNNDADEKSEKQESDSATIQESDMQAGDSTPSVEDRVSGPAKKLKTTNEGSKNASPLTHQDVKKETDGPNTSPNMKNKCRGGAFGLLF